MPHAPLLADLDKAVNRSARLAIKSCMPIKVTSNTTLVGSVSIEKGNNGLYNILSSKKEKLYHDIMLYDVAVIIAQRYNSSEFSVIHRVLHLEGKYAKHHTDMLHYLSCLKQIKGTHDLMRMAILEDKFQVAEQSAKQIKDSIYIFKKIKY